MKKENFIGLVIYLFIFAFAIIYGLTVLQTHFQNSAMTEIWQYAIYIIGSIVVGLIITALLFGLGHLLGAKIGGYKVVSANILYFCFYKEDKKWKFRFRNYDGITGETVIVPNYEKNPNPNPIPFLTYGPIFNLAWFVGTLVLFFTFNTGYGLESDIAYGFLTVGLISAVLFIYDILPVKLDTKTNGSQLLFLKKNGRKTFNELLLAQSTGEVTTSKEENKEVKAAHVINNTAEGKVVQLYALIDDKKYKESLDLIEEILKEERALSHKSYLEVIEQSIYVCIMSLEKEEMLEYYEKEVPLSIRRDISNDSSIIGIRTYLLMSGLLDKSRSECLIALKKVAKAYKNTASNRKHAELVLFNEALEKVCLAHPKWELEIYKLFE